MKKLLLLAIVVCFAFAAMLTKSNPPDTFSNYVDDQGRISLPKDYRINWTYLDSWVVPKTKAPGHGFHDVFTQPESAEAYKKNGSFPDGTVLIKEIRSVKTGEMTSGEATWAGDIDVWFVMIKDNENRFAGKPNWGDSWRWALIKSSSPEAKTQNNYKKECFNCHITAKKTDYIYMDGFTLLRK